MTEYQFYEEIRNQPIQDYIVSIRLRYDHETEWEYLNELYLVEDDLSYEWLNDWYEGQQQVEILGYFAINDVAPVIHAKLERWYEVKHKTYCEEHIPHSRCSNCLKEYEPYEAQFMRYCPNCGAKMDLKEDVNE